MSFEEVLSEEHAVRLLRGALRGKRIPHAYLFIGPSGVGKRLVATKLAQALNCSEGDGTDGCGHCSSCRRIEQRIHPDLVWIAPRGKSHSISIEEVRELRRLLEYRPFEGGWKVCIMAEAERMRLEAANALLKTLEEPAPRTVIVLTSEHPERLPQTITSRCQAVRFSLLKKEDVEQFLERIPGMSKGKRSLIAALSGGSPGRALRLAEEGIEEERDRVIGWVRMATSGVAGAFRAADEVVERQEEFQETRREEEKQRKKASEQEEAGSEADSERQGDTDAERDIVGEGRRWLKGWLDILLFLLRDLLVLKVDPEGAYPVNVDRADELRTWASNVGMGELESLVELVEGTRRFLDMNVNVKMSLGVLFLSMRHSPGLAR